MLEIDLSQGSDATHVLVQVFQDAMRKLAITGRAVKSISYSMESGLWVRDENNAVWQVESFAKVVIPSNLLDDRAACCSEPTAFCPKCDWPSQSDELCGVCEYLSRARG